MLPFMRVAVRKGSCASNSHARSPPPRLMAFRQEWRSAAAKELEMIEEHAGAALAVRSAYSMSPASKVNDDGEWDLNIAAETPPVEEHLDRTRVRQIIADTFGGLGDRERDMLSRRLLTTPPPSLDSLAAEYSLSRERIGQIQKEAMRHVRIELKRRGLGLSDLIRSYISVA